MNGLVWQSGSRRRIVADGDGKAIDLAGPHWLAQWRAHRRSRVSGATPGAAVAALREALEWFSFLSG